MSLSGSEYLEHLGEVAATAGIDVREVVLPAEHHVILRRMRFRYLDWGARGKPLVLFRRFLAAHIFKG